MGDNYSLSRRKMLGGFAALGGSGLLASPGGFSDTEAGDASVTAGNWTRAVFSRGSPSMDLLDVNGVTTSVSINSGAEVTGPTEVGFSNLSGPYYAPYVYQESDLRLVDFVNGTTIILDTPSGTSYSPYIGRSVLTTGKWVDSNGADTAVSVFYIAKNGTSINRVVPTSPSSGNTVSLSTSDIEEIVTISSGIASLLGIADLNQDGERELYVVTTNGDIKYLSLGGSTLQATGSDTLETLNAAGAPRPTYISNYGTAIPYAFQGDIKLLYYDSGYQTTTAFTYTGVSSEDSPAEAPIRICDYDGDGQGELLYVTQGTNNELRYADIPTLVTDSVNSGNATSSNVTTANTKTGVI